ncbi:MAG TPA: ATP-binding cassette domain-containing protein, partial [Paracoccus sp. (in: a-proteobacteria)]|nr:ATP-binding cassette domain-containing protein [Paracoccus sp. (in: a-proteobacteria)]
MRLDLTAKSFGDRPVLGALTLAVARGERVAILGPSGIGKSTLLRIVAGLLRDFDGL